MKKHIKSQLLNKITLFALIGVLLTGLLGSLIPLMTASAELSKSIDMVAAGSIYGDGTTPASNSCGPADIKMLNLNQDRIRKFITNDNTAINWDLWLSATRNGQTAGILDLTNSEVNYLKNNAGKDTGFIVFRPGEGDAAQLPTNTCTDLQLVQVSDTTWKGPQMVVSSSNLVRVQTGEIQPYMTFQATTSTTNGELTGNLTYAYVDRTSRTPTVRMNTIPYTIKDERTTGASSGNSSGGESIQATWENTTQLTINGETYTKMAWDDKDYYFLTKTSNTARQSFVWNGGLAQNEDPFANPTKNCVPFIHFGPKENNPDKEFLNIKDRNTQGVSGFIRRLSDIANGATGYNVYFVDYAASAEAGICQMFNKPISVSLAGNVTAKTFFLYNSETDAYKPYFQTGGNNEKPYIGEYTKRPSGGNLYGYGGPDKCVGQLLKLDDITPVRQRLTWYLANDNCQTRFGETEVYAYKVDKATYDSINASSVSNQKSKVPPKVGKSCESEAYSLGWVVCPIIGYLDTAIGWLDDAISGLLQIDSKTYNNDRLRQTWGRMRDVALLIILPITMFMIISTALGFGPFEAYTLRKVLPRLFIAIFFISTSWYITDFAVQLSNTVGQGVYGLVTGVFQGDEITLRTIFSEYQAAGLITGGAVGFASLIIIGSLGPGILLSYMFAFFIALMIGFVVLTVRQAFILALIISAPIAILSWIFPGNDKIWKAWKQLFVGLLLMYPIIYLLIGTGKIFAAVIQGGSGTGVIITLMKLTAYVAPYFLIPSTFKLAGGLFASLTGMVNDKSRGVLDRNRKYRQGKRAEGWHDFKTGNGSGFLRKNAITRRVGLGVGAGMKGGFGFGNRGSTAIEGTLTAASDEKMKTSQWQSKQFDDGLMRALTYKNQSDAIKGLQEEYDMSKDDAEAAAQRANYIGYSRASQVAASRQLAMNKTGYDDKLDSSGNVVFSAADQARAAATRAAGGNNGLRTSLLENIKYTSKQVGRQDLGDVANDQSTASVAARKVADPISRVRQHTKGMKSDIRDLQRRANVARKNGDIDEARRIYSDVHEMQQYKSYATGDNGDLITDFGNSEEIRKLELLLNRTPVMENDPVNLGQTRQVIIKDRQGNSRVKTQLDLARDEARAPTPTQQT